MLKEIKIKENRDILVGGRTIEERDPVTLVWGGSYIELTVNASELWIEVSGPHTDYENWMAVEIDGSIISRQMVPLKRTWIPVFMHRDASRPTHVRIYKEVQAMSGDLHHAMLIYSVKTDGSIIPTKERKYKFEVIGDSITSSEGCIGAKTEEAWISMIFSHTHSYSYLLGKKMDADIRCISQSGFGIIASWDGKPEGNVPDHYEEICSLCMGEELEGFKKPYDFSTWKADAVIINLGTNDASAFSKEDGVYLGEDIEKVQAGIISFLKKVRKNNPNAYIIWALGMFDSPFVEYVKEGVEKYIEQSKDEKTMFVKLPAMTEETTGARFHPGVKNHEQAAETLENVLKKVL